MAVYDRRVDRNLRMVLVYFIYLFSAWSVFRYFSTLPEIIEELWFKPVLFLVPLFFIYLGRGVKPNLWRGNLLEGVVAGLLIGGVLRATLFMLVRREMVVDGDRFWISMLISLVEQVTFAGLILPLVNKNLKNGVWSSFWVAVMYGLIHIPLLWLTYGLWLNVILGVFLINFCVSFIANMTFLNTKNIVSPILVETLLLL